MCRQGAAALVPSPLPIQPYAPFLAELLGTMLLVILGDGVVANVVLNKTKGQNAGWIVITAGWGFGVAVAVYAVGAFSGAHLNPAVTIDRKSTRLNSSHSQISYAVFCLKKKKKKEEYISNNTE